VPGGKTGLGQLLPGLASESAQKFREQYLPIRWSARPARSSPLRWPEAVNSVGIVFAESASLGSICSATELRPLDVTNCARNLRRYSGFNPGRPPATLDRRQQS
jgi:hypothetical protein